MSVTIVAGGRTTRQLAIFVTAIAVLVLATGALDGAWAQFGAPRNSPPPAPMAGGFVGWILLKQAQFYRQFSGLIRAARTDGSALWGLLAISFVYGIFHAAGPGHGKAVISSYLVANEETWKRGIVLSFVSALVQALVAVAIVGVAAVLLNATASTMRAAVDWIEIVSYSLIILIGVRLLWVKGIAFFSALRKLRHPDTEVDDTAAAHAHHDHHDHGHDDPHHHVHERALEHAHAGHGHSDHAHPDHAHAHHDRHDHAAHAHHHHDHDDDASAWGHAHAPEPQALAGPGGWRRGLSAVVAVGLRPCSGAIIVLVFALANGLFWAGVAATLIMGLGTAITVATIATIAVGARAWAARFASTRAGYGILAMRGIEVGAALVIIAFGALLLTGYMVSERMVGV